MKTARFAAIVVLLAAILVALIFVFRLPLAGWAARSAMASAGLESPQLRVTALTFNHARLEDVAAGPSGARAFSFDLIEADYGLRRLLFEKKVGALRAGPGQIRLLVDEAGNISLPGVNIGGGSDEAVALPFDSLSLLDVAMIIAAPDGSASGTLNADYDLASGGAAAFDLATERLTWNSVVIANAKSEIVLKLSADGQARLTGEFTGDAATDGLSAKSVAIALDGEAASWRDAAGGDLKKLAGVIEIKATAPDMTFGEAQAQKLLSAAQMELIFGQQLERAAFDGAVEVRWDAQGYAVRVSDPSSSLALATPDGASLRVRGQGEAPLYARTGERETSSLAFNLMSDGVDAAGAVDFERTGAGWRLAAPLDIAEYSSPSLSVEGSRIDVMAVSNGGEIEADVALKSGLRKAVIGRLTVTEAPFNGAFKINADMAAQRATISSKSDCFAIESGRGVIAEQNLSISLAGITLCNAEGPLAVYTWTGDAACTLEGDVSARNGTFKMGETVARGRPPVFRFNASYHPAQNTTSIKADLANGAMVLNEVLDMAELIGRFDFRLDADGMHATANVDRLRMTQHLSNSEQLLLFAPVIAAGQGGLEGDDAVFTYTLTTPEGHRLGAGAGVHDMNSASGETTITIEKLTFAPAGLQPNRISPALKGIVDAADGAMNGAMVFSWTPKKVLSIADFQFDNISFGGPTRAVTRTRNLNGSVQLTDLLPIQTNGVQTITVAGVNLDALVLERGVMEFSLPGDDTFVLQRGEFPWFGGTIGVYDAKASFAGQAEIPLRAQSIDLKQVLDYVKIEGLTGEGILTGSLPLIFEDGRARIVNGVLKSEGPGFVSYEGVASDQASEAGENADVAFDFLRNLRYSSLEVTVDGALDGALKFGMKFEGVGDVSIRNDLLKDVPVIYRINLAIENIDLLRKANLASAIRTQIERELGGEFQ